MRRESDRAQGERTGVGRRARDRLLAGAATPSPSLRGRAELQNMILFLADDLRESALAMGGIEAFVMRAQRVLEKPELSVEDLHGLVDERAVLEQMDLLWDSLSSLRKSMSLIQESLRKDAAKDTKAKAG
jgi:hypothetical protein